MATVARDVLEYALEVYLINAKHGPAKSFEACLREGYYVVTGNRATGSTLPDGIKNRRKALSMSQQELSEITGISRNYISMLERDSGARESVSLRVAATIARALQADVGQLFEVASDETRS